MAKVKLTLVDVSLSSCQSDDNNNTLLPPITEQRLDVVLSSCATAQDYVGHLQKNDGDNHQDNNNSSSSRRSCCCSSSSSNKKELEEDETEVQARMKQTILRYMKRQDQYMALASILFKSQAFHLAYYDKESLTTGNAKDGSDSALPIVELPRTTNGKPYIPTTIQTKETQDTTNNVYPLSISHQFPFVGMARLEDANHLQEQKPTICVGLDIVMFDKFNTKLYANVQEFVNVFQDCFTVWEWNQIIQQNESCMLHEFYVRWAMKESYTKALGLGMSFDFASFETKLQGVDNNDEKQLLWPYIEQQQQQEQQKGKEEAVFLCGNVTTGIVSSSSNGQQQQQDSETTTATTRDELWNFFFLPLRAGAAGAGGEDDSTTLGCACVCVGPLSSNNNDDNIDTTRLVVEHVLLSELEKWHQTTDQRRNNR